MLDAFIPGEPARDRNSINFLRALMGDEPVRLIYMVPGDNWDVEEKRLQGLFPEATNEVMHPRLLIAGPYLPRNSVSDSQQC